MDDALYLKVIQLKDCLEKDPRIIKLNNIEKEMSRCDELMKLSYRKDMACLAFNDALKHFAKNSKELKEAQVTLYEAKLNLDMHPLSKKYNQAYKEVKKLYALINKTLFEPFSKSEEDFSD